MKRNSCLVVAALMLGAGVASATVSAPLKVLQVRVYTADGSATVNLDGTITTPCTQKSVIRLTSAEAIRVAQTALLADTPVRVNSPSSPSDCSGAGYSIVQWIDLGQ